MDVESLTKLVSKLKPLAEHVDYIRTIAKPCVDIELTVDAPTPECSRFGGDPFVPADFQWPLHDVGKYCFLGQINFAEILDPPPTLPQFGLLSIFYAYDEDGECFWGDDGYVLGFYCEDFSNYALLPSPTKDTSETQRIKLTGGLDVPRHEELRDDWPFDPDLLDQLSEAIDANHEYMLGYPSFTSLAYDPTPGPEWLSLLTVHSLNEFDWCWHDDDKLMVFIEADKLANKDFSHLKSDAG